MRAIHDAHYEFGIIGRLIAAIDREASPEAAVEMVGWVAAHRCDEVIGIGIDYREVDRPPELFVSRRTATRGAPASRPLRTRASSACRGPTCAPRSTCCSVDRIDHGYTVVDDAALRARMRGARHLFTVVPTNSYYLRTLPPERWALDHPIRRMPGLGLRIHPEHRRPDAAPRDAHPRLGDDGARLRLRARRPARLHAQRARRRVDRRHDAPRLARRMERRVRRAARAALPQTTRQPPED